jgi:hypothetical protein
MHMPVFLIQLAVLVIFVISAYRSIIFAQHKAWPDFLFNAAIAVVSFAYLFNHLL